MQTMTLTYAPGRSPFARLLRNQRRMIENLRQWQDAAAAYRWEHTPENVDAVNRARDTFERFAQTMIDTYGPFKAERMRDIAGYNV